MQGAPPPRSLHTRGNTELGQHYARGDSWPLGEQRTPSDPSCRGHKTSSPNPPALCTDREQLLVGRAELLLPLALLALDARLQLPQDAFLRQQRGTGQQCGGRRGGELIPGSYTFQITEFKAFQGYFAEEFKAILAMKNTKITIFT